MGRKVGIDLGTTNSVVAIADGKLARVLRNREGEEMTLSVVSVPRRGNSGEFLVGTPAYRNWKSMPKDTALSIKRLMGRGFEDEAVQKLRTKALYEIKSPADGTSQSLRVVLGGRERSPIEISAEILKKLKTDAEAKLDGESVTHAVITVPAYFSEVQRKATRDAARQAGLEVIQILDEPTAAAIAFGLERPTEDPRTVLVYDFGGGTFDISILTWAGHVFVPMNLEGDMWLGGDDLDEVIVDKIVASVLESDGVDIRTNNPLLVEVKQEARRLKEALSASERGDILITSSDIDIDFSITREEFELGILPLVATYRQCACGQSNYPNAVTCHRCGTAIGSLPVQDGRAISLVRKALENANLTLNDIEYVLLAGNTTNVPLVRKALEHIFGPKIKAVSHPKLVVAEGAAIVAAQVGDRVVCAAWNASKAAECGFVNDEAATVCQACSTPLARSSMADDPSDVVHARIAPFDYSLGLGANQYFTFVKKSDPYPTPDEARRAQTFHTQQPNQPLVFLPVYGGDSNRPEELESQGKTYVRLPPNTPAGFPVKVSIWLDLDGTFRTEAATASGQILQSLLPEKGEAVSRAADALVAAEIVVEERKDEANNSDIERLRQLRAQTLEQMFSEHPERAVETATQMNALAQEWGQVDRSLRDLAEGLVRYSEMLINTYGWAFDSARLEHIRTCVRNVRAAMMPGADGTLFMHFETLDTATDDLPEIVALFLGLHRVITDRIEPRSPARAMAFRQELRNLVPRFAVGDRAAQDHLRELAENIAHVSSELGPDKNEAPRECATCKRAIQPGARYCAAGHDSWLLRGASAALAREVSF